MRDSIRSYRPLSMLMPFFSAFAVLEISDLFRRERKVQRAVGVVHLFNAGEGGQRLAVEPVVPGIGQQNRGWRPAGFPGQYTQTFGAAAVFRNVIVIPFIAVGRSRAVQSPVKISSSLRPMTPSGEAFPAYSAKASHPLISDVSSQAAMTIF